MADTDLIIAALTLDLRINWPPHRTRQSATIVGKVNGESFVVTQRAARRWLFEVGDYTWGEVVDYDIQIDDWIRHAALVYLSTDI